MDLIRSLFDLRRRDSAIDAHSAVVEDSLRAPCLETLEQCLAVSGDGVWASTRAVPGATIYHGELLGRRMEPHQLIDWLIRPGEGHNSVARSSLEPEKSPRHRFQVGCGQTEVAVCHLVLVPQDERFLRDRP